MLLQMPTALPVSRFQTTSVYGYYTSLKEVPQRSKGETYNLSLIHISVAPYENVKLYTQDGKAEFKNLKVHKLGL